ncbi:hypothetical protein EJ08DRAFT_666391, partial [Tothia fuscella]
SLYQAILVRVDSGSVLVLLVTAGAVLVGVVIVVEGPVLRRIRLKTAQPGVLLEGLEILVGKDHTASGLLVALRGSKAGRIEGGVPPRGVGVVEWAGKDAKAAVDVGSGVGRVYILDGHVEVG